MIDRMTEDSGPSKSTESMDCKPDTTNVKAADNTGDSLSSQRVFKKTSPNAKLTLYLSSRDLVVSAGKIDRLTGVLLVDPEFVDGRKVYGQITLTFRYGREDEEVMGLKFCNEAIMSLAQLYPPHPNSPAMEDKTPLQEALIKRLGPNAYPFSMEITPLAPPSVQLVPAKEYNGAPIGTSYDIRAYVAEKADEKSFRRGTVRMGIRVVQRAFAPPPPLHYVPGGGQKTGRERAKNHRKALLEGRSGLEVKFTPANSPCLSMKRNEVTENVNDDDRLKVKDTEKGLEVTENSERHHRGASVTFKNQEHNHNSEENSSERETKKPPDSMEKQNREDESAISDFKGNGSGGGGSPQLLSEEAIEETPEIYQYRPLCGGKRPSLAAYLAGVVAPSAEVEKPFLLSDGRVHLTASLDKGIYSHGEEIAVKVHVRNGSNKTVKRIKVFIVQHVDVCMFSNGKFKNVVAMINTKDDMPIQPETVFEKTFVLLPVKSTTKNWIALEDSYTKSGTSLSSTVTCTGDNPEERNVFAIYVSYYVKVKLMVSVMGGQVSLKLPFTLMHTCSDLDHVDCLTRVANFNKTSINDVKLELKAPSVDEHVKQEKDGT